MIALTIRRNALILQGEIPFCFFVRVEGLTPNSQSLSFKKFMAGGAENSCLDFGGETLKN